MAILFSCVARKQKNRLTPPARKAEQHQSPHDDRPARKGGGLRQAARHRKIKQHGQKGRQEHVVGHKACAGGKGKGSGPEQVGSRAGENPQKKCKPQRAGGRSLQLGHGLRQAVQQKQRTRKKTPGGDFHAPYQPQMPRTERLYVGAH